MLRSSGCLENHRDPPAFATHVLGLKLCATIQTLEFFSSVIIPKSNKNHRSYFVTQSIDAFTGKDAALHLSERDHLGSSQLFMGGCLPLGIMLVKFKSSLI